MALYKVFLLLTVVASVVIADKVTCKSGTYPPPEKERAKTYQVNLDLPPHERWHHVVTPKKEQIKALMDRFIYTLSEWGKDMKYFIQWVEDNMARLDHLLPSPFAEEVAGISNATGLKLGEVVLYNIFYEISAFCTSIVAEDSTDKVYHARNMDFEFGESYDVKNDTWYLTEMLRPLLLNVDYMRGGKVVFSAVHYAGYIGVVTGIRPGGFSVSINARTGDSGGGVVGILEWVMGKRNGTMTGFLTRSTLENATHFSQAEDWLTNTPIVAPVYYILGGKNKGEGAVITRNRDEAVDVWPMAAAGGWYILETNYDHWKPPIIIDNRRGPANQCMKETSQKNVGIPRIFDVLATPPVYNKGTIYTALMHVESGHLETWVRRCMEPDCPPF